MTNTGTGSVRIGRAAQILGVSPSTIRRFEREGTMPTPTFQSGHRRYNVSDLLAMKQSLIRKRERHDQTLVICRQDQILHATEVLEDRCWVAQYLTMAEATTPDMIALIVSGAITRLAFLSVDEFDLYSMEPGASVLLSAIDQAGGEIVLLPASLFNWNGEKPC